MIFEEHRTGQSPIQILLEKINEDRQIILFESKEKASDLRHNMQTKYPPEEIKRLLEEAGLSAEFTYFTLDMINKGLAYPLVRTVNYFKTNPLKSMIPDTEITELSYADKLTVKHQLTIMTRPADRLALSEIYAFLAALY